jgi:excisionase family DNA binding protein
VIDPGEIMTLKDVAEFLKCHESTVYRQLKKGNIPRWRLGRDWRFNRKDILRWIANGGTSLNNGGTVQDNGK